MQINLPDTKLSRHRTKISHGVLGAIHTARSRPFYNPYRLEIDLRKTTLKEFFPDCDDLDKILGPELIDVFGAKTVPVFPKDTISNIVERMIYTYDSEYRADRDTEVWISKMEAEAAEFWHGSGKAEADKLLEMDW